jgi:hypothetical protein
MESDLVTAQIEKITRVPGIMVYTGKETTLEKFSIPKLIFVIYSDKIITIVPIKEITQIERNLFFSFKFNTIK